MFAARLMHQGAWQQQQLVAVDGFPPDMPTAPLYATISVKPMLFLANFTALQGVTCFEYVARLVGSFRERLRAALLSIERRASRAMDDSCALIPSTEMLQSA